MFVGKYLKRVLFLALLVSVNLVPASARVWKATPDAVARDYAMIQDVRSNGELVIALWFVPTMIQQSLNGGAATAAMLDKYVVILVVHAHQDQATGAISFDEIPTLDAKDRSGKELAFVPIEQLPPAAVGMLTSMETVFRQSLGAMGKGMRMFVFDPGASVHACGKGGLSVPFGGETYTWDTPIPGCPHA